MTIMNKKRYLLPAIVVHEIETQSVLQMGSEKEVEIEDEAADVDESTKSKDFNINLWD